MKFIDLNAQYQAAKRSIDGAIQRVLDHGQFIMGPEVVMLEQELSRRVGVKHCILNSSGTTALQVAMMALGIGPGDEVITPAFSFFATAEVILLVGAKPVYVDIDPHTFNIDPALIPAAITERTKAIIPVGMFGQCANMDAVNAIAARHHLPVIEDGAQSFGAKYKGRASCGLSVIGCTSFFPSKPLGCYGDAGACFTDDDNLAHQMRLLINHGQEQRYYHTLVGINGRCDTLQASILLAKLALFDDELVRRAQVAQWYNDAFAGVVRTPLLMRGSMSAYAQYTIQVSCREELQQELVALGIPTTVHYPRGLHQQPASKTECYLPVTEMVAKRVLSLPFHPYMTQDDVQRVASGVKVSYGAMQQRALAG